MGTYRNVIDRKSEENRTVLLSQIFRLTTKERTMYKTYSCFLVFLLICILICGCNTKMDHIPMNNDSSVTATSPSEFTEKQHQKLLANILTEGRIDASVGDQVSFPALSLNDVVVTNKEKFSSAGDDGQDLYVYLLGDYRYSIPDFYDGYIAVEQENAIVFYDLLNESLDDELYLCDLDADGNDEIIVHQVVDEFGGGGQHLSRVFKIKENNIHEIFSSDSYHTGFHCGVLEAKNLEIVNTITGYSTTISIADQYSEDQFDNTGRLKYDIEMICDGFLRFAPKDIDEDGIFEIECLQLCYLDWLPGYAKSVLKYNNEEQQFEVIQAEYFLEFSNRTE